MRSFWSRLFCSGLKVGILYFLMFIVLKSVPLEFPAEQNALFSQELMFINDLIFKNTVRAE